MLQLDYAFFHISTIRFPLETLSVLDFLSNLLPALNISFLWKKHFGNCLNWLEAVCRKVFQETDAFKMLKNLER